VKEPFGHEKKRRRYESWVFLANVHNLATKKKQLANPTKGFLRFKNPCPSSNMFLLASGKLFSAN
jgi:hypothetical protein